MEKQGINISALQKEDVQAARQLSMAENWNQAESDWRFLIGGEGNVCIGAWFGEKLVGTTTAIVYQERVAWTGMVLVDREFRGQGISKAMLTHTFMLLKDIPSIKLDATPAGHPVYRKLGFIDECILFRMTRQGGLFDVNDDRPEPMKNAHLGEAVSLDASTFGSRRESLVGYLAASAPELMWMIREDHKIKGFILGRHGSKFTQIGPLCAANEKDAMALVAAALGNSKDRPVLADVPGEKVVFRKWLESAGFVTQRPFTRMYLEKNPFPGKSSLQYLISGPEFG